MIGESLRQAGFFALDAWQGGAILRHLKHIKELYGSTELAAAHRELRLQHILRHAAATTSFYAPYKGASSLADYPVVPQSVLRSRTQEFTTTQTELMVQAKSDSTSGSYAMPLIYPFNGDKYARRKAEVLHSLQLAGYRIGRRIAVVHGSSKTHAKSNWWYKLSQNVLDVYVPTYDKQVLAAAAASIAGGTVALAVGWPTLLQAIAETGRAAGLACHNLQAVVTYGEVLGPSERNELEAWFGCRVYDRYAMQEAGVLAHELPGAAGLMRVNDASYAVELLDLHHDRPAAKGAPARIVVTDLYSTIMPLIRYDTGDLVADHAVIDGRQYIGRIDGRCADTITDTRGELLPGLRVYSGLNWEVKKFINQFQIIQTAPAAYEVLIVPRGEVNVAAAEASLKALVGEDAVVTVLFVEAIERLPSGKHASVLNRMQRADNLR